MQSTKYELKYGSGKALLNASHTTVFILCSDFHSALWNLHKRMLHKNYLLSSSCFFKNVPIKKKSKKISATGAL